MDITHLGLASFKIRGKTATIITDPFNPKTVGIKFPKVEADVITISHGHDDHNYKSAVEGNPIAIEGPGEYEVKGVKIVGVSSYHDSEKGAQRGKNTVYRFLIDGVSIVHCGDLGHKFDDVQLESLAGVNILLVPTGGVYTIDAALAAEVVSQIDPDIVIPMHYNYPSLNQELFGKMAPVDAFLKQMGKEGITPQPKLTISKDKLPAEPMVVVLE